MTAIDRLHQAEAAYRASNARYQESATNENARAAADDAADLLAALDAARGEAVAWRAPNWAFGDEWQYADEPFAGPDGLPSPNNQPLYAAPPAALVDGRMADALRWIIRHADAPERAARGPHRGMAAIKHVAQSALAQQPAAAVPEVLCTTCGQPTMHMGSTCYGCGQAAMLAAAERKGE